MVKKIVLIVQRELEEINEIYGRLGWTNIVVVVAAYPAATIATIEDVVVEIGIAEASLQFKVKMLREHEGKAIGNTRAIGITLIALIGEHREVGT